jgi:small subunit ribosomal protein S16
MSVMLRLARGGQKKRPYYRIVATDKRNARDGRFIEQIGAYNPMLPKDSAARVTLVEDRIKYWLSVGAQPSERVQGFLFEAGLVKEKLDISHRPQKTRKRADKKTRAELRAEAEAEAKANAEAEAAAAAAAPAEEAEAPAEEAAAE